MCRRTEEEVGPTVGLPHHRLFVGFFHVATVFQLNMYIHVTAHRFVGVLKKFGVSELVFYVTCNDISCIYVTAQMYRRTEEVGLPTP